MSKEEKGFPDAGALLLRVLEGQMTNGDTPEVKTEFNPVPSHSTKTSSRKCLEMNPRHWRLRD
jgi:hypothetical protein